MLELILIRHGQTEWNKRGRIMGRRPIPLNARGRAQARRVAKYLSSAKLHAVYSSPVLRASQTAEVLARRQKITVREAEALLELNYGDWIGHYFSEVRGTRAFQKYHLSPARMRVPGGESVVEAQRRIMTLIRALQKRYAAGERRRRVALVSHADMIKLAVTGSLGFPLLDYQKFRIDHCTVTFLWFYEKHVRLITINAHTRGRGLFQGKVPGYLVRYHQKKK